MRKIIIISGLCMFYLWFTACTDPFAKEEFMAYDELPLGLYLESQPQYSHWVKLLKTADLFNAINISNVQYTCFVADNAVVDTYIKSNKNNGWETIDDLTEEEARNLLGYHILPTNYAYGSLSSGKLGTQTVSGDYLTLTMDLTGRYINIRDNRFVKILEKTEEEIPQINGYFHEIEAVLDPILYTVMEVLEQTPNYSIFTEALKLSGLDAYLNVRDFTIDETRLRDYKAVMVVSDSVFHRKKIYNVADLNKLYEGEPSDIESDFYRFMGFHILKDAYDYGDLTAFTGTKERGTNVETFIAGEFISLQKSQDSDSIFLNPLGPDENLQIISDKYNIQGCNGFIHEISGLMPICEPIRYYFEWEPTEWPEFRTFEFYREDRARYSSAEKGFFEEETEHVRWQTIPYKEDAVGYWSIDVDGDRFLHDDGFRAELGPVGWVEFDTPNMMRGRYKIEVVKYTWSDVNNTGGGHGIFQMYIDGIIFGPDINFGKGTDPTLDLGIFTFTEAGPHVFRFRVIGSLGELMIDRFLFTPINE